ncbi:MAG: AMP-binding protein [Bacteriovoracaceae bacterium]|nr:AMP-binding protein [Bacteriovoracaceae bacterium]
MNYWIDFLEKNALEFPNKIAIIDQESARRLTYKELNHEVELWSSVLLSQNVSKKDSVAFLNSQNCLAHLTLMLACSKIGALFVPLNFRLSKSEIEEVVIRLEPKLYIGNGDKFLNVTTQYLNLQTVDFSLHESKIQKNKFDKSGLDETILMLFTSGSTGVPKGVMFHGEMLLSNQVETCKGWGLTSDDVTLVETPFFHTGGYNVLLLPLLYLGGTAILAQSFNPDNVFDCIEKEKVSVYFGVPTMFQMLLEKPRFKTCDFSSLRFFISGGAACSVPMIEEYQKKNLMFKQGFGLTEVGPNYFLLDEKDAIRKSGSIGKPMPHSIVRVETKDGKEAMVNEPGELLITGPHVCAGYYQNAEAFKETYKNGYFYTGDLVKFDEEGFFYVVGRIKDMYISGGENVYPGEVERQITSHAEISEAVVVSVPSEKWGEVGFAFLKTNLETMTIEALRDYLNPLLSRYKHPHYICALKDFPLLANGKVDRKILKKKALEIVV